MKVCNLLMIAMLAGESALPSEKIGRPVRVLSLSFNGESLETILQ